MAGQSLPYTEYRLVSSGTGSAILAHVVKFPAPTSLQTLSSPITMHRRIPELADLELTEAEKRAQATQMQVDMQIIQQGEPGKPTPKAAVTEADIAKIAPGSRSMLHNAYAKSQASGGKSYGSKFVKKTRQMFFGVAEDGEDPLARAKKRDPDRYPWVLRDSAQQIFVGSVEVDKAASDRVLFVVMPPEDARAKQLGQAFIVTPITKIHKMNPKPKFHTFTTEEAEDKMKQKRGIERWMNAGADPILRKKTETDEGDEVKLTAEEKMRIIKSVQKQNPTLAKTMAANAGISGSARQYGGRSSAADGINEDIDFDEVMSDDENPDFGIENEEDAREAKRREYGREARRLNMDEFDESDKQWQRASLKQKTESKAEKKLKKALKKHEEDSYVSDDDEAANIFGEISEEEDSEQELETKQPPKPGDPAPTAQQGSTSPNVSGSKASSPSLVPAVSTPDPAKLAKQKKKELDISGYDAVSAARKAMYSSVIDTNQLRSLSGFTVAGGASSAMAKVVTGGSGAVIVEGGKSPDAPKGRSPDLNSSTPKIRLKVGGTVVTAGESQKRKADDSKLETSKRPKTEPPPPPTAAEVIGGQRKKSSNSKANSPNLSANGSSGDSKQRSKATDSRTSPNVQMPAASPRIEELRGGSKSSGTPRRNESETSQGSSARPSPSVSSGGTPTSTPSVNASTSASPSLDDANTLTDAELRSLFAPPNTVRSVRELVALVRDKMRFKANQTRLGEFIKSHCKVVGVDQDGTNKRFALRTG